MVHLKIVVALLACVAIVSTTEQQEVDNYIVGGQTARPNQFPFIVSLRNLQNFHFCGASIISDRWILSAAHCTQGGNSNPENVVAVLGAHHRANDGQAARLDSIVNHPQYNQQWLRNDICVLRTAQAIRWVQGRIQPLRLPTRDYTEGQAQRVWIAGWGLTGVSKLSNLIKIVFPKHIINYIYFSIQIRITTMFTLFYNSNKLTRLAWASVGSGLLPYAFTF